MCSSETLMRRNPLKKIYLSDCDHLCPSANIEAVGTQQSTRKLKYVFVFCYGRWPITISPQHQVAVPQQCIMGKI